MASEPLDFTDEQKQAALALLSAEGDPWTLEQLDEALEVIRQIAQGDPIGTVRKLERNGVTSVALRLDAGNGPIWRWISTDASTGDLEQCDWPISPVTIDDGGR
jgi:hypothetical protein